MTTYEQALQACLFETQCEDFGLCRLDEECTPAAYFFAKKISGAVAPNGQFFYAYRSPDDLPNILKGNVDIFLKDDEDSDICLFKIK